MDEFEAPNGQFWLDIDVLEQEEYVDIRHGERTADDYWKHGWISGYCTFHRRNSDTYKKLSYKVFPTRYRLFDLRLTKSLRRVLKRNADLKTVIRPLRITEKKEQLHKIHHELRYGEPHCKSLAECYEYIKYYPTALKELCVFKDEKLVACSIFEVGTYSIYSNSAFWDLEETARSLGILTVLLEMQYAVKIGFDFYYLGHYYLKNPLYQYKTRFPNLELYDWENDRWVSFKNPSIKELLTQKLPYGKYYTD